MPFTGAAGSLPLESVDAVDENGALYPDRGAVLVELAGKTSGGDVFSLIQAHQLRFAQAVAAEHGDFI